MYFPIVLLTSHQYAQVCLPGTCLDLELRAFHAPFPSTTTSARVLAIALFLAAAKFVYLSICTGPETGKRDREPAAVIKSCRVSSEYVQYTARSGTVHRIMSCRPPIFVPVVPVFVEHSTAHANAMLLDVYQDS